MFPVRVSESRRFRKDRSRSCQRQGHKVVDRPLTEVRSCRPLINESSHRVLLRVAWLNEDKGEACRSCTSIQLVAVVVRGCASARSRGAKGGCPRRSRRTGPNVGAVARSPGSPGGPSTPRSRVGVGVAASGVLANLQRRLRCLVVASAVLRASPVVAAAAGHAGGAARKPPARVVGAAAGVAASAPSAGAAAAADASRAARADASRAVAVVVARAASRAGSPVARVAAELARARRAAARAGTAAPC